MSDYFVTEFGHKIPFVPEYFERNKGYAYYTKGTQLHEGKAVVQGTSPLSFAAPAKDWVSFSSLLMFLARSGQLQRWQTGVDLGGGEGTIIRLFKAAGFLEEATNVDRDDYSAVVSGNAYFERFLEMIEKFDSVIEHPVAQNVRKTIEEAKFTYDHFGGLHYREGMIDKFSDKPHARDLHMDLMDTPGTYDFVVSCCCFDYLDLERVLPKVRGLLKPGGLFAGLAEYWWWPVNSTGIIGHFPYAGARLSFDDLVRYYGQFHPDLSENLFGKYHYFHEGKQHPTITDWASIGRKHGLRMIAIERVIPKAHMRLRDCPRGLFAQPWFDHNEVLRDIHYLKPDVGVDDLFTSIIRMAMVAI